MVFIRQIGESFANFASYRAVAAQRAGQTFRYFIMLYTIIFLLTGMRFAYDFMADTKEAYNEINAKLPSFTLSGGVLQMEGPQPFVIDPGNNAPFIVDTTGKTDEAVLDRYTEGLFVSRDSVVMKQGSRVRTLIRFADFKDVTFDKPKLMAMIPQIRKWVLVFMAVFGYIFKMVWVLIATVILALLGMVMGSGRKLKLPFAGYWNVAVYAFSLPLLLEMVVDMIYPGLPYFWAVKWGLAMYFVYRAIQALADRPGPAQPPESPVI